MEWLGYVLAFFVFAWLMQGLANKLNSMHDDIWSLKSKNRELEEEIIRLGRKVDSLDNQVDRLKNPAYYASLDSDD